MRTATQRQGRRPRPANHGRDPAPPEGVDHHLQQKQLEFKWSRRDQIITVAVTAAIVCIIFFSVAAFASAASDQAWHKHPLIVVLVSGIFGSGLLRAWQNNQKELGVKIALVADLSQAIGRAMAYIKAEEKNPHDSFVAWETSRRSLEAKLRNYYPDLMEGEWKEWNDVIGIIEDWYKPATKLQGPGHIDTVKGLERQIIGKILGTKIKVLHLPFPMELDWTELWRAVR